MNNPTLATFFNVSLKFILDGNTVAEANMALNAVCDRLGYVVVEEVRYNHDAMGATALIQLSADGHQVMSPEALGNLASAEAYLEQLVSHSIVPTFISKLTVALDETDSIVLCRNIRYASTIIPRMTDEQRHENRLLEHEKRIHAELANMSKKA